MKIDQAIVVTTKFRGVFFGYLKDQVNDTVTLRDARNCIYWPVEQKGFIGLCTEGPVTGAKVGPAAEEMVLYGVASILKCSDEAVQRWESAPWS